jgi:hypothetical protein
LLQFRQKHYLPNAPIADNVQRSAFKDRGQQGAAVRDAQSPIVVVIVLGRFPAVRANFPPLASFPYPLSILAIRPDPQPTTKDENDRGCTKRNKEQSHQASNLSGIENLELESSCTQGLGASFGNDSTL